MKGQWGLILALVFALVIAIFSVINVDQVTVNYLFGEAKWPLILVIIGSVLMGGLIVGAIGIVRVFRLQRTVNRLSKQLQSYRESESLPLADEEEREVELNNTISNKDLDNMDELNDDSHKNKNDR